MNKKKIASVVIALSLVAGAGAYGTRAYFTDRAETSSQIITTIGSLKVTTDDGTSTWTYVPEDGAENDQITNTLGSTLNSLNTRPGDKFAKTVTATNSGTLTQNIKITTDAKITAPWGFTIDLEKDSSGNVILPEDATYDAATNTFKNVKPGQTIKFNMVLTLSGSGTGNTFNTNDENVDFALNLNQKFITVEATQPNAK